MVLIVQKSEERLCKVSVPKATLQNLKVETVLLGTTLPQHNTHHSLMHSALPKSILADVTCKATTSV